MAGAANVKRSTSAGPSTAPGAEPVSVFPVYVSGWVTTPGVVEVGEGSIVADAIEAQNETLADNARAIQDAKDALADAKQASTEATAKATAPIINNFRRPMRSPNVPMVMSDPATRKP